jgi:hypothetical protein
VTTDWLMSIAEDLDRLRHAVPGCDWVAYADLSSGLVLAVSADRRPPQEALDTLPERAAQLLDAPAPASALGVDRVDEALDLSPDRTAAYLRSRIEPVEILCCVGSPAMDVAGLLAEARAAIRRIDARSDGQT